MNLRAQSLHVLPENDSRSRETDTNLYRGITLWNSLHSTLMNSQTPDLKLKLGTWKGEG